jgi:hypothetical protein
MSIMPTADGVAHSKNLNTLPMLGGPLISQRVYDCGTLFPILPGVAVLDQQQRICFTPAALCSDHCGRDYQF